MHNFEGEKEAQRINLKKEVNLIFGKKYSILILNKINMKKKANKRIEKVLKLFEFAFSTNAIQV
jgi:hypothetical protein